MAKRILVAVIFLPILFVIMFFLPPVALAVVFAFISAMSAYEFLRATGAGKMTVPMKTVSVLSAALIPLGAWLGAAVLTAGVCGFVVMSVSFWCAIRAYDGTDAPVGFYHVMLCMFSGIVVPVGLSCLVVLKCMEQGKYLVLLAMLLTFATDSGAYFVGMFLGKHRGVIKVSPKKSLEGYIGGFVAAIVFSVAFGAVVQGAAGLDVNYLSLVLIGFVGGIATMLGDLAFSLVKREYHVKDYGNLLPGHGGMMDRFDSMVFCAPVVLFIVTVLPVF